MPKIRKKTVEVNPAIFEAEGTTYISTDKVLMNDKGTYINGKYDFYPIASFAFLIRHLIKDSKDNVFRIIEIPLNPNQNGNTNTQ